MLYTQIYTSTAASLFQTSCDNGWTPEDRNLITVNGKYKFVNDRTVRMAKAIHTSATCIRMAHDAYVPPKSSRTLVASTTEVSHKSKVTWKAVAKALGLPATTNGKSTKSSYKLNGVTKYSYTERGLRAITWQEATAALDALKKDNLDDRLTRCDIDVNGHIIQLSDLKKYLYCVKRLSYLPKREKSLWVYEDGNMPPLNTTTIRIDLSTTDLWWMDTHTKQTGGYESTSSYVRYTYLPLNMLLWAVEHIAGVQVKFTVDSEVQTMNLIQMKDVTQEQLYDFCILGDQRLAKSMQTAWLGVLEKLYLETLKVKREWSFTTGRKAVENVHVIGTERLDLPVPTASGWSNLDDLQELYMMLRIYDLDVVYKLVTRYDTFRDAQVSEWIRDDEATVAMLHMYHEFGLFRTYQEHLNYIEGLVLDAMAGTDSAYDALLEYVPEAQLLGYLKQMPEDTYAVAYEIVHGRVEIPAFQGRLEAAE